MGRDPMQPRAVLGMDNLGLLLVEDGEGGIEKMKLLVIAGNGLKVEPVATTNGVPDQLQARQDLVRHAGVDQRR